MLPDRSRYQASLLDETEAKALLRTALGDPLVDRLSRRVELICQLSRQPACPLQLDHLSPELRRIAWALLAS